MQRSQTEKHKQNQQVKRAGWRAYSFLAHWWHSLNKPPRQSGTLETMRRCAISTLLA